MHIHPEFKFRSENRIVILFYLFIYLFICLFVSLFDKVGKGLTPSSIGTRTIWRPWGTHYLVTGMGGHIDPLFTTCSHSFTLFLFCSHPMTTLLNDSQPNFYSLSPNDPFLTTFRHFFFHFFLKLLSKMCPNLYILPKTFAKMYPILTFNTPFWYSH